MNSNKLDKLRIEVKDKVDTVRFFWSKKGLLDIMDILEEKAVVIKKPIPEKVNGLFSGFSTYIDDHFVVFINTALSLGRQRFTAAHELYHLEFDVDQLTREKAITKQEKVLNEKVADIFASEFLMPEDAIKEYCLINWDNEQINPSHVIRIQHRFKVSYIAMLIRLLELGIITSDQYNAFSSVSSKENHSTLSSMTKEQGLPIDLIKPTNERSISKKHLQFLLDNYKNNKISYSRLSYIMDFVGLNPSEFEIHRPRQYGE